MNASELDKAWRVLPTPDSAQVLQAVPMEGDGVWAAVDQEGRRHLLLEVPEEVEAPATTTRGLYIGIARHQVAGADPATYLDLICLSDDVLEAFTAVAAEIGASAANADKSQRAAAASAAIVRWKWFWGVELDALSAQAALGLFSELWFLHRWTSPSRDAIDGWTGSAGSRHDFQWRDRSVEVKGATRRADGAILHHIVHLDQLADPESGSLFLFSLRVVHDHLAHNTLPDLVDRISETLRSDPDTLGEFSRKVGERGYSPAQRQRYETPYRILGENMYVVGPGFPRLTAASFGPGIPAGVTDVSYLLDMAACDPWLVATQPANWMK